MTLPSFLVIGAMKAGSTSLFRWLGEHPEVRLPAEKEPNFFSDDRRYARGRSWYESLFPEGAVTGEASVGYTDPAVATKAAQRAAALVPSAKLIFLVRDPLERMRSHYRHEVQRGREKRTFPEVLSAGGDPYVRLSRYSDALAPWRAAGEGRLLIVRFEQLVGPTEDAWRSVLDHLGLAVVPRPAKRHNVTATKEPYKPLMRWMYDAGLARFEKRVPRWVKRLARPLLLGDRPEYASLIASSEAPVPDHIRQLLTAQVPT